MVLLKTPRQQPTNQRHEARWIHRSWSGGVSKMSNLNAQQWVAIKKEMYAPGGSVRFSHDGHRLTLYKRQKSETQLDIVLFIDDINNVGWGISHYDDYNEKFIKYMCPKTHCVYSPAEKARIIKAIGKREAKKHYDLDKKFQYWLPMFTSFKAFKSVFSKLDNLTLEHIGFESNLWRNLNALV